jgi:hypothetical protein
MQINGIDSLVAYRRQGKRPALPVWLWIGFDRSTAKGVSFDLDLPRASKLADVRGLVGLDVVLCAKAYSPALMEFFDHVKAVSRSCVLWVEAWGDGPDSMMIHTRQGGTKTLEECAA